MGATGKEALGSMGNDAPLACLSLKPSAWVGTEGGHGGAAQAAVRVLQAVVRAGDEPTCGPAPRVARHVPAAPARAGGQPAGQERRAVYAHRAGLPSARPRRDVRVEAPQLPGLHLQDHRLHHPLPGRRQAPDQGRLHEGA
eukprot:3941998-Rhodomonas_salina.1